MISQLVAACRHSHCCTGIRHQGQSSIALIVPGKAYQFRCDMDPIQYHPKWNLRMIQYGHCQSRFAMMNGCHRIKKMRGIANSSPKTSTCLMYVC